MATKPILFNTEMVKAILDGRKTVTRRAVKGMSYGDSFKEQYKTLDGLYAIFNSGIAKAPCQPGDILWVRETFGTYSPTYGTLPKLYYKADGNAPENIRWQPSIFMSLDAARIFLRVNDVKVERLQDITMNDMVEEGVVPETAINGEIIGQWRRWQKEYMKPVWDSTTEPKDRALYGWSMNPWVFVIGFERTSRKEAGL